MDRYIYLALSVLRDDHQQASQQWLIQAYRTNRLNVLHFENRPNSPIAVL